MPNKLELFFRFPLPAPSKYRPGVRLDALMLDGMIGRQGSLSCRLFQVYLFIAAPVVTTTHHGGQGFLCSSDLREESLERLVMLCEYLIILCSAPP